MAKVIGMERHLNKLKGISLERIQGPIGEALFVTADAIKADAQVSITNGAVSGKGHVPSKPGQPPKNDTGGLANGIESVMIDPFHAQVSSNAPYAAALEYGTSRMAERPYMRPAAKRNKGELTKNVNAAIAHILSSS